MTRRLVLNIAMSLDGFIARTDGSYDWIEGHGTNQYDTALQFDNRNRPITKCIEKRLQSPIDSGTFFYLHALLIFSFHGK